jgi:hypothetical protein
LSLALKYCDAKLVIFFFKNNFTIFSLFIFGGIFSLSHFENYFWAKSQNPAMIRPRSRHPARRHVRAMHFSQSNLTVFSLIAASVRHSAAVPQSTCGHKVSAPIVF